MILSSLSSVLRRIPEADALMQELKQYLVLVGIDFSEQSMNLYVCGDRDKHPRLVLSDEKMSGYQALIGQITERRKSVKEGTERDIAYASVNEPSCSVAASADDTHRFLTGNGRQMS